MALIRSRDADDVSRSSSAELVVLLTVLSREVSDGVLAAVVITLLALMLVALDC